MQTIKGNSYQGEIVSLDFNYNTALIKFESTSLLLTATLRNIDCSVSLDLEESKNPSRSFGLHHHGHVGSQLFKLGHEDKVIALGRH